MSWARPVESPQVRFELTERFGWHVWVEDDSPAALIIASFPWYDYVDAMLAHPSGHLPPLPTGPGEPGRWEDLEQGWLLTVTQVGEFVYVANTDFDGLHQELTSAPDQPAHLGADGVPRIGAVEITWTRLRADTWRHTWESAIADFLTRTGAGQGAAQARGER